MRFLDYTSQFGGYKVALVASAEQLNINAANSLLKTLEEPPANSLLLLVTPFPSFTGHGTQSLSNHAV
ncbi:MAG: hypothetical protein R3F37_08005 [Candidatus Competibacteraceae bacterium]